MHFGAHQQQPNKLFTTLLQTFLQRARKKKNSMGGVLTNLSRRSFMPPADFLCTEAYHVHFHNVLGNAEKLKICLNKGLHENSMLSMDALVIEAIINGNPECYELVKDLPKSKGNWKTTKAYVSVASFLFNEF
jgi:hypothetical protein